MNHLGDYNAASIVYGNFNTKDPLSATPYTLAGSPALAVYKDDGTTESTSGITLTTDFDGRTGLNNFKIDTSSDGTFYAAGHNFSVVITAGTVNGISVVGAEVGSFTLSKKGDSTVTTVLAAAAVLKKNTAVTAFPFEMRDSSGALQTGKTVTSERSIDGAAFSACANTFSELAHGGYNIDLAAGDLNGVHIRFRFSAAGCSDTIINIFTQP